MQVPKGKYQMSGGKSIHCRHARPVANALFEKRAINGVNLVNNNQMKSHLFIQTASSWGSLIYNKTIGSFLLQSIQKS